MPRFRVDCPLNLIGRGGAARGSRPPLAKGFRPPEVRPLEEGRHLKISSPEPVEVAEARLLQAFERAKYAALLEIDDTYGL